MPQLKEVTETLWGMEYSIHGKHTKLPCSCN